MKRYEFGGPSINLAFPRSPGVAGRVLRRAYFGFSGAVEPVPQGQYSGTTQSADVPFSEAIPAGSVLSRFDASDFAEGQTVTVSAEASFDGGETWLPFGAASFAGGAVFAKDGVSPGKRTFGGGMTTVPDLVRYTTVVSSGSVTGAVQAGAK